MIQTSLGDLRIMFVLLFVLAGIAQGRAHTVDPNSPYTGYIDTNPADSTPQQLVHLINLFHNCYFDRRIDESIPCKYNSTLQQDIRNFKLAKRYIIDLALLDGYVAARQHYIEIITSYSKRGLLTRSSVSYPIYLQARSRLTEAVLSIGVNQQRRKFRAETTKRDSAIDSMVHLIDSIGRVSESKIDRIVSILTESPKYLFSGATLLSRLGSTSSQETFVGLRLILPTKTFAIGGRYGYVTNSTDPSVVLGVDLSRLASLPNGHLLIPSVGANIYFGNETRINVCASVDYFPPSSRIGLQAALSGRQQKIGGGIVVRL